MMRWRDWWQESFPDSQIWQLRRACFMPPVQNVEIYWDTFDDTIYDGDPPSETWVGGLNTEGGWTEK